MKKVLTFLLTALLTFGVGWATTETITMSQQGWTNGQSVTSVSSGDVDIVFDLGTNSNGNAPKYYTTGSGVRLYVGNTMTISADNNTITAITITFVSGYLGGYSANVGNYSASGTTGSWSGSATSVVFTAASTSRMQSVTVTYSGGSTTVDAPTITPDGGEFVTSQTVTLSHADADAIYYTLDGSTPTTASTPYSAPFTINATTTVKAIAVKNGVSSSPASATFTMLQGVPNIAAANALSPNTKFGFTGSAIVTYQNGSNLWIRDNTGSGLIYGSGVGTFANGDILAAGWTATYTYYSNAIHEYTSPSGVQKSGSGTADPEPLTTLTTADVNKYVILSDQVIAASSTVNNRTNYTVSGVTAYNLRDQFGLVTLTVGKKYDVVGVVSIYSNSPQLYLISATEVTAPTLLVNPASMTIDDSGTNNTLTITGNNISGSINASLANNADWYLNPNTFSNTGGTATVEYTGRALSASNTVNVSANDVTSVAVPVNYVADLYIVTDNGVTNDWHFDGTYGVHMTYNNGVYTAPFTVTNPNTFILFARKLGNGVGWNTRYVFGPDSNGDYAMNGDNTSWFIDVNDDDPIKIVNPGTYIVEIDANAGTFTITKETVSAGDFELVTNVNDLVAGNEVIIVSSGTAGPAKAMSIDQRANNRGETDVTVSQTYKVTATDSTQIFTLESAGAGNWYFNTGDGYICAASNSSNYLRTKSLADAGDNAKAAISITNGGEANIQFQGSYSRNTLRHNVSSQIFACYAYDTNQPIVYIYQRAGSTEPSIKVNPALLQLVIPAGGSSQSGNVIVTETNTSGATSVGISGDGASYFTATLNNGTLTVTYNGTASQDNPDVAVVTLTNGTASATVHVTGYREPLSVTITPADGAIFTETSMNGTISSNVSGATIYYRIDGGEWQEYDENDGFTVTASTIGQTVTVEAYATYGNETSATVSATYTYKSNHVSSIAEFLDRDEGEEVIFDNSVIVLFDYSQNSSNGQEYLWVKDRTGYTQFYIAPQFDDSSFGGADEFVPKYENGDVIPPGFKVKKNYYEYGQYYQGQCYEYHSTFQDANTKALADPEQVTLSELLAYPEEYNNRYLYINKLELLSKNNLNFTIAADEDGDGTSEVFGSTSNPLVEIVGYNKYNSPAWKNKQGQTIGVPLPDLNVYQNVTFIFQKWQGGYEIMPITFTPWKEDSLRLEDLVEIGELNHPYTISNQLKAAVVTWDEKKGMFAIFAKDDEMYANPSKPGPDMNDYLIRFKKGTFVNTVEQKDYDQSNWIEILIPQSISGIQSKSADRNAYQSKLEHYKGIFDNMILKAGSIKGNYVDTLNPTIVVSALPVAVNESEYDPNIFCTANFLWANVDPQGDGALSHRDNEYYFMMDAKPQEYCKVVWAYFIGDDNYFVAPTQEADTVNGLDFYGSFLADMSLCDDAYVEGKTALQCFSASDNTTPEKLYGFRAVIRKNPNSPVWNANVSGAPRRITPSQGSVQNKESEPAYIVYPLDTESTSNESVTAVKEVVGSKTIVGVRYYNIMGMESQQPFQGINIVVTQYSDGSFSTTKVLK